MQQKLLTLLFLINLSFVYSQDFRYGKVSKEELEETQHPKDPDADAAILYREENSHFDYSQDRGFFLRTDVFERIKIYNKDGYKWATNQMALFHSNSTKEEINVLKGVTYNLDNGKIQESKLRKEGIFDEERSKFYDLKKFTMPDIRDGSVIEYKYTLETPFVSNINEIKLQEEIPLNKAEIRFSTPEYLVYKMHQKGWLPIKIEETSRQRKLSFNYTKSQLDTRTVIGNTSRQEVDMKETTYEISVENVPAIKEEAFCGNIENYMSALKFELSYTKYPGQAVDYRSTTWESVTKNIYDSPGFGDQLKGSRYFEDDVDAIIANTKSLQERVLGIFEMVKQRMTWNTYLGLYVDEGVKDAYEKKSGNSADINLMLVAMLRYAKIDANPVILSTKDNGIPLFPTRDGFNYVIAEANLDGSVILMDATDKRAEINIMKEELLNWDGMLIKDDGSSIPVDLFPKKPAIQNTLMTVNIDKDLGALGKTSNRYEGHYAMERRARFSALDADEKRMNLEGRFSGVELFDVEMPEIETLYQPVKINYNFENESVEKIADKVYFNPMFHLAYL
ncbi:MAG: DUF3857 domain-containing protein, partial [Leeuwenhoekiella sp.]